MSIPQWQAPPVTPGPAPGLEFAGYGARIVAYIVDVLILSVVWLVLLSAVFSLILAPASCNGPGCGGQPFVAVLIIPLVLIPTFAYFPVFWAFGGQTAGMKLVGIRVVRDRDGGRVGGGRAILRLIGYWISGVVFYLGFIWIFVDSRRRGWHDLIAGTVVIKS